MLVRSDEHQKHHIGGLAREYLGRDVGWMPVFGKGWGLPPWLAIQVLAMASASGNWSGNRFHLVAEPQRVRGASPADGERGEEPEGDFLQGNAWS
jgi:hypothetical protein